MKSEALRQLIQLARKRMAAEDDESLGDKMEAEAEKPLETSPEEVGPDMEALLSFMKSKAVPEPTSRMAALKSLSPSKSEAPKAKGAHLFKKVASKEKD